MARKSCLMYFVVGCACAISLLIKMKTYYWIKIKTDCKVHRSGRHKETCKWRPSQDKRCDPITRTATNKQSERTWTCPRGWKMTKVDYFFAFLSSTLIWICPCLTHQLNLTPFPRLFNYFGLWIGICFIIWVSRLRCCELHAGGLTFNEIIIGII